MMGLLISKNRVALFVPVLLLLTACVPPKKAEPDLTSQKTADVDRAVRDSEQDIGKGDLEGALEIFDVVLRKYPGDRTLLAYYLKAVEAIRNAADNAFNKEEFAASGRTYAVLRNNFPNFQEIAGDLSFDRDYLQGRLTECSDRLSKLALTQYRQGNLIAAISLWKSILDFDPGNAGVKKAIDTATIQLKNLERKTK